MIGFSDRSAIEDRLARLAWAIAQGDRVAFGEQFADGANWEMNCDQAPDQWLDDWLSRPSAPGHQIWTTNLLITPITADRVVALSYLIMPYFGQTVVPATFIMALGTATDELVRVRNEWLLLSRRVAWGPPASTDTLPSTLPVDGRAEESGSIGRVSTEDRLAIADLYADYAWALDTGDGWGCAEMFTPKGLLTDPGGRFEGRAAIFGFLGGLHASNASFRGRQHWVGSPMFSMETSNTVSARAFACVTSHHPNGAVNLDLIASYFDKLEKLDGQWWFVERLITPWTGEPLALFPRYAPTGEHA